MSVEFLMEISQNLFNLEQIRAGVGTDNTLIFEEITGELEAYILEESDDADSTEGVFDFLTSLPEQLDGEFEELLDGDSDKKRFLRALSKIFALLLNTKVDTAGKNLKKKILKITIEKTIKIWQATVRRMTLAGWSTEVEEEQFILSK